MKETSCLSTLLCLSTGLLCLLIGLSSVFAEEGKKPNVVVIFTDDHGYADLGCMEILSDVKTPNIDLLAKGGVRMAAGYVTAPQCGPSRCGLISGQYQNRFGMEANGYLKDEVLERFQSLKTLPKRLKEAGYVTGIAGKSHLGSDECDGLSKIGFDKVFFKHSDAAGHWNMDLRGNDLAPQAQPKGSGYHLELLADFTCAFIDRYKDQPFFFYLALRAPHVPIDAPKKYTDRFPGRMPEERRKALGALSCIDDGVGKIMQTLRSHGLEKDTLIFFISDNGAPLKKMPQEFVEEQNGLRKLDPKTPSGWPSWDGSLNTPMKGEKGMLSEGGIRVPFLVYWKDRIPGGQVYQNPVISLDVAATANALAGLPKDPELDGVNLLPFLTGENRGRPHETLYWRWAGQFAIRQGDWKYLASGDRQYLFNLESDAEETRDLLAQNPDLSRELRGQLETWSQRLTPPGLVPTQMTAAASGYFDFYLDGKKSTGTLPKDSSVDGVRKNLKRNKRAPTADVNDL